MPSYTLIEIEPTHFLNPGEDDDGNPLPLVHFGRATFEIDINGKAYKQVLSDMNLSDKTKFQARINAYVNEYTQTLSVKPDAGVKGEPSIIHPEIKDSLNQIITL